MTGTVASDTMIEAAAKALIEHLGMEWNSTETDWDESRGCARVALAAAFAVIPEADSRADETPLAHRDVGGHWLRFDFNDPHRPIIGCHCGFDADLDSDGGLGDSVLDHFEQIARADERAKIAAEIEAELVCDCVGYAQSGTAWEHARELGWPVVRAMRVHEMCWWAWAAGSSSPGAQEQQR